MTWPALGQESEFVSSVPRDISAMLRAQLIVQNFRDRLTLQYQKLSPGAREENQARALSAFNLAQAQFEKENFMEARKAIEQVIRLDPLNDQYFYSYGVILYKLNLFRRSLAVLNMLESTSINQVELTYYEALDHMNLKEDDLAYSKFISVRDEKDEQLSAIAAMYAGVLAKKKEDFTEARNNFEFVLDFSKDPKLDQKAEDSIIAVNQMEQFQAQAKKKWGYSFYTGAIYDGNVLNISKANQVTSTAAYRLMYGGLLSYKALFTQKRSLLPQITYSDIYSVNTKFKSDATIQSADPMQVEVSVPYRYQFTISKKAATWYISPAYQKLYMSYNEAGRELVFDSAYIASSVTVNQFTNWISDYRLEFSKDTSHIVPASPADEQSATKYNIVISQTRWLDTIGKKNLSVDLLFSQNKADGSNMEYRKYILSVGSSIPISEQWLGYGRVDYLNTDYNNSAFGRLDKGFVATVGGYRSLGTNSSVNLSVQYYSNSSTVSNYDYDKFAATAMYVYRGGFL
jgi:tetratricopeptide (TPR) repeat protein